MEISPLFGAENKLRRWTVWSSLRSLKIEKEGAVAFANYRAPIDGRYHLSDDADFCAI
jgi:hypothetical protein